MRFNSLALCAVILSIGLSGPAHAGPVVAFLGGLAASFAGSVTAAFAAGGFFASAIGQIVLGYGLQLISGLLRKQPASSVPRQSDQLRNFSQPVAYQQRGYGRVRTGGAIGFTGFRNSARYNAILLAAHSTRGPVAHWLDKFEVQLDAGGGVTTEPIYKGPALFKPADTYGFIWPHTGQPGQVADPVLRATFQEITASHDFAGISYAVVQAKRPPQSSFSTIFPTGQEWAYAPVWDMNDQVFDPRSGTYGWTQNAALIIAHEIVQHLGGMVDWDAVGLEADWCDQIVTNGQGGQQRRWTINGMIIDDLDWDAVREQLLAACDGFIWNRPDGKVGFYVGRWMQPTLTLTERDFLAFQVTEGAWGPDAPSEVAVEYIEPDNDYIETMSGIWIEAPTARRVRVERTIAMVDNHNQASRLAKRIAKADRPFARMVGTIGLIGYEAIGERFVRVEHAETGHGFYLEITKLTPDDDGLTFAIEGRSVLPTDFDFDALTEEPARPVYAEVESDDTVAPPVGLTGAARETTGGAASIEWSWPDQPSGLEQQLRVRAPASGEIDWRVLDVPEGEQSLLVTGLLDGATYEGQLRNVTAARRSSDWRPEPSVNVAAIANQTPPDALQEWSALRVGSDVSLTWLAPNSPEYAAVRVYRATDSTDLADAVVVRTEFGGANQSDSYVDAQPGPDPQTYWGEPINASGIPGPVSAPVTITFT